MNSIYRFLSTLLTCAVVCVAPHAHASLIVNGDFETGDLSGWVNTAGATIDSSTPLAGSYSAVLPNDVGPGAPQTLSQSFSAQTAPTTVSFTFSMADPAVRGMQIILRQNAGNVQVNLQVVDLDDDGDGDVQLFQTGSGYQTVLSDAVTFDTPQSLSLTFNGFGSNFDYDLTVGSQSANGLSFWQNGPLNDLYELQFVNQFSNTGYEIDNVFVGAVPEPSSAVLVLFSWLGLTGRQRRA